MKILAHRRYMAGQGLWRGCEKEVLASALAIFDRSIVRGNLAFDLPAGVERGRRRTRCFCLGVGAVMSCLGCRALLPASRERAASLDTTLSGTEGVKPRQG